MVNHETYLAAIEAYDDYNKNAEKKKKSAIVITSYHISKKLCEELGFFGHLVNIRLDRRDPAMRRHVWIFRYDPALEIVVNELIINAREAKGT